MSAPNAVLGNGLAITALFAFSANIVVTRLATSLMNLNLGFVIAVTVNAVVALIFLGCQIAWRGSTPDWNWTAAANFTAAGVFATFLGRWIFFESIVYLGAARASAFQVSSPVFVALLGSFLLNERLSVQAMVGILVTVLGLVVLSSLSSKKSGGDAKLEHGGHSWKVLLSLGLGSSLAYAIGNVFRGAAVRSWDEPILGALLGAIVGLLLHLSVSWRKLSGTAILANVNRQGVIMYMLSGALTIIGQILMITAMTSIPVATTSVITLCTPLLVLPMSWLWLKKQEAITPATIAGIVMTLLGVTAVVVN